jgi:hypothetical protein
MLEELLYGGNQNTASQLILSLSQTLNIMSANTLQTAASG